MADDGTESHGQRARRRITSSGARPAQAIRNAPRKITSRSGTYSGKGMLAAELLAGFGIILIRIIGDFTVDDTTGKVKTNVLHNSEVYGPFPIAIGLIGVFFVLSFLAAAGGLKAKIAVIFGGVVVTALGVKSTGEIDKIAKTIGNIGTYQVPAPSGTLASAASNKNIAVNLPGTTGTTGTGTTGTTGTGTTGTTGTGGIAPTPTGTATLPLGDLGGTGTVNPGGTQNPAVDTSPAFLNAQGAAGRALNQANVDIASGDGAGALENLGKAAADGADASGNELQQAYEEIASKIGGLL